MNSDFDALRIKTEDGSAITAENVRDEPQHELNQRADAERVVVRSSVRFPKIRSSTSFSGSNKALYGSPESRTWVADILGIAA